MIVALVPSARVAKISVSPANVVVIDVDPPVGAVPDEPFDCTCTSTGEDVARPLYSNTAMPAELPAENVTVIVSPLRIAVAICADRVEARARVVFDAAWASPHALDLLSVALLALMPDEPLPTKTARLPAVVVPETVSGFGFVDAVSVAEQMRLTKATAIDQPKVGQTAGSLIRNLTGLS